VGVVRRHPARYRTATRGGHTDWGVRIVRDFPIRAFPSSVRGPVLLPPCILKRPFGPLAAGLLSRATRGQARQAGPGSGDPSASTAGPPGVAFPVIVTLSLPRTSSGLA
jgi:hypothetical protein